MPVDRSATSYLILHYVVLIVLIFAVVVLLETAGVGISLWLGVGIAIVIGLLYPQAVKKLDVAPEQWDS